MSGRPKLIHSALILPYRLATSLRLAAQRRAGKRPDKLEFIASALEQGMQALSLTSRSSKDVKPVNPTTRASTDSPRSGSSSASSSSSSSGGGEWVMAHLGQNADGATGRLDAEQVELARRIVEGALRDVASFS